MCGIAGFWGDGYNHNEASVILNEMGSSIAHRGPDDSGVFFDERSGLGLAHRRLSILDLSSSGSQPMVSKDDRYVIVFNGEIYNHLEIRKELDAASANPNQWKGYSDTETILAGFLFWGVRATLTRLVGMFAIALWDKQSWTLTLIRDRVGEKPLYYGIQNKCLVFGSELKALKKHSKFNGDIDRESLALYFKRGFIPAPNSIYKGVFKLPQASLLEINLIDVESKVLGQPELYWSLENTIIDGHIRPLSGSFERNSTTLESTLLRSVTQQQISDVPVGAFLSGGIDSSLIAALMQSQSSIPVSTFTIGFEDADFNEANQAKVIAKKLGTSHNELYMPPSEGLKVIPQLPHLYDEPFADPSQLPMILLAEMTKRHVTVALSGDGGDELFGGYNRYLLVQRIWKKVSKFPLPLRKFIIKVLSTPSIKSLELLFRKLSPLVPERYAYSQPIDKLTKLISVLDAASPEQIYTCLISHLNDPIEMVLDTDISEVNLVWGDKLKASVLFEEWMMAMDIQTYLPDDVLVKVDRASMGSSLEVRAPLLDHRVIEEAWKIPFEEKVYGNHGKMPLRNILYKYIPEKYFDVSKKGFGVPIADWLRGPLRDWAEIHLDEALLIEQGYLNSSTVRKMWCEHLKGEKNWQYQLWDVLMFQSWLEYNEKY